MKKKTRNFIFIGALALVLIYLAGGIGTFRQTFTYDYRQIPGGYEFESWGWYCRYMDADRGYVLGTGYTKGRLDGYNTCRITQAPATAEGRLSGTGTCTINDHNTEIRFYLTDAGKQFCYSVQEDRPLGQITRSAIWTLTQETQCQNQCSELGRRTCSYVGDIQECQQIGQCKQLVTLQQCGAYFWCTETGCVAPEENRCNTNDDCDENEFCNYPYCERRGDAEQQQEQQNQQQQQNQQEQNVQNETIEQCGSTETQYEEICLSNAAYVKTTNGCNEVTYQKVEPAKQCGTPPVIRKGTTDTEFALYALLIVIVIAGALMIVSKKKKRR